VWGRASDHRGASQTHKSELHITKWLLKSYTLMHYFVPFVLTQSFLPCGGWAVSGFWKTGYYTENTGAQRAATNIPVREILNSEPYSKV
jgi:hypothetical protein